MTFGVRPEHLEFAAPGAGPWRLKVEVVEQQGSSACLHCSAPAGEVLLHVPGQARQREGEVLDVRPAEAAWHLFGADELRIGGEAS